MKQLVLFDIDGTLLSGGPHGRLCLDEAITEAAGQSPRLMVEDVAGFTDLVIVRTALAKLGWRNGRAERALEPILEAYIRKLERVYPGAPEPKLYDDAVVLADACRAEGWSVGLLTGNIREAARIKLDRFGIWDKFPLGIFGDDAHSRDDLLWLAPERAWEVFEEAFPMRRIVLVGDTANDARVARLSGVRSLIVCRRAEWRVAIEAQGPTWLVESLDHPQALIARIRHE